MYLDLSKINRLTAVSEQVNSIMNAHTDVVLYISNGNRPEYWTKDDFSYREFLNSLEGSGGFFEPDLNELTDVKNINNYFSENDVLSGLDDFFSNDRYTFYFLFYGKHLNRSFSRSPNEMIIKPLLLSNKLLNRDQEVIKNCKVTILYDDPNDVLKSSIKSKITENYEFKNF